MKKLTKRQITISIELLKQQIMNLMEYHLINSGIIWLEEFDKKVKENNIPKK